MRRSNLLSNRVLVEVFEIDRDAIFNKAITTESGETLLITKNVPARKGSDKFYSQSVNIGKVVQVSDDAKHIYQVDDVVVFDMTLDTIERLIYEKTEVSKLILIQAFHSYETEDYYTPPHELGGGKFVYRKGAVKDVSKIFCIIRNGEFKVINGFILCEHQKEKNKHTDTGVFYNVHYDRDQLVSRQVLMADETSVLKKGDWAFVEQGVVFPLDISGRKFDCFEEDDICLQVNS